MRSGLGFDLGNPEGFDVSQVIVILPKLKQAMFSRHSLLQVGALVLALVPPVCSQEPPSYNRDVRPILADKCFSCHGVDSAARQADLRLDQRDFAIESGAIAIGDVDASELIARIESDDPDRVMPPPEMKKKMTSKEVETLRRWIQGGAEYEPHWSFIAPKRPALPEVQKREWPKTPVDYFVLKQLEERGLDPAPEAEPHRLFRRLHLDITGLPPSPEMIQAFVSDYESSGEPALAEWIDRLLQSPQWGEHRARYWLDAARYGDTHGMHFDNYREMWPYRDWVIQAFNANQPFDEFTLEQLAGDLLPNPTREQLIATGFQRCNMTTNEGGTIDEENEALYAADRVQTLGWVFLGLTTNCSQCHDHKFDPITMRDYYSLAAFFRNTTQPPKDGNSKDGRGPVLKVPALEDLPRWNELPGEIAAAKEARDARRGAAKSDFATWLKSADPESMKRTVATDAMVAWLPLDEGVTSEIRNLCDSSTVTATGEIAWIPDGKLGPAPVMNAGATLELGGLGDFEIDQAFSYGAWVKAGQAGVMGGILARMDEQADYRGWDLWQNGRSIGVHMVDKWPDNAMKVVTEKAVLDPAKWQHVFVTYDGSRKPEGIRVYLDGQLQKLRVETNSLKEGASIQTQTPMRIGQRSHSQVFDGGSVQDVRMYARALEPSEVQTLASNSMLIRVLGIAEADRSAAQTEALYEHFLANHDAQFPELEKQLAKLESELSAIDARSPITHIQKEREGSVAMTNILMRGEYDKKGDQVTAATPAALHPLPANAPANRLGLAQWLIDPANPLTARVTVNRFWQQLFGRGIVVTAEDFGVSGALPSHPELIDYLAVEFQESGWNVKQLFKQILMSATYRQSALSTSEKLELDRDNVLLSRGPRFRMDAEMIRDYALSASGLRTEKMFGSPVKPYQPEGIWDVVGLPGGDTRNYEQSTGADLYRRSIYTFWKRMAPPPSFEVLNAPSREVCTVRRERTNTPLQALVTLNDPQFVEAARVLATNGMRSANPKEGSNDNAILAHIADRTLCRPLSVQEQAILLAGKEELAVYYREHPEAAKELLEVGESGLAEDLELVELAAWTLICNEVLNLDEVLTK